MTKAAEFSLLFFLQPTRILTIIQRDTGRTASSFAQRTPDTDTLGLDKMLSNYLWQLCKPL